MQKTIVLMAFALVVLPLLAQEKQPDAQQQREQRAAPVADERQRQPGGRQQLEIDAHVHHRLEGDQRGNPITDHRAIGVAGKARRPQAAQDHERHQQNEGGSAD
mgnify:CR=1 FL=1